MKEKILIVNGCSMTYGLELVDDKNATEQDHIYRQKTAWPGQLKDLFGFTSVLNFAVNSGSYDRILRTTIYEVSRLCANSDYDIFVIIGWSGPARREFYIDGEWMQVVPYHDHQNTKLNQLNRVYREVAWNDKECAIRFLTEVVALQSFLEVNKVPYLFFDAISPAKEQIVHSGNMGAPYIAQINAVRYMNLDDINGCMADILRKEVPVWNGRHPSPEGHKYWASVLFKYIEKHQLIQADFTRKSIIEMASINQEQRSQKEINFIYT